MASLHSSQMTSFPALSSSAVVRMPASTSLSAFSTRQPRRRSTSMKLAADGSATIFQMGRPPASCSRASAYSPSVFWARSALES